MRGRRLARCLICPALLLGLASGCQSLHRYRPVPVLVKDAETDRPIPGAAVSLSYPFTRASVAPCNSSGAAKDDGVARLRAAPYGGYGIRVEAASPGYAPDELHLCAADIEKIEPAHLFEATDRRPAALVVALYAEPRFTVELVVPRGYRGLVKADVEIGEDVPAVPGQRCYRYEVSWSGDVKVKGPAVLGRVPPATYRARFADGTLLDEEMDADKVGFRWLKGEGKEQTFVVGTQADYATFRRRLVPVDGKAEPKRGGGGHGGGGGGGRHRRGGQSSGGAAGSPVGPAE
jgi:hypothetical protein